MDEFIINQVAIFKRLKQKTGGWIEIANTLKQSCSILPNQKEMLIK